MQQCVESHPMFEQLVISNEPGLVLFTSGSSGSPKAVLHSITRLLNNHNYPRRRLTTFFFLMLDHIGGINTLFYSLMNGCDVVCSDDYGPGNVSRLIDKFQIQLLPTTPTFLRMLFVYGFQLNALKSLQVVTYGTEPMPASLLDALTLALPSCKFKQTYGSTELAILPTISRAKSSTWFSISNKVGVKIIDGRLWLRASTTMLGYLNSESVVNTEGWYDTGDEVEVDGNFIRVLGRGSEIINVGGQKVFPSEIEAVIQEVDNVADAVVSGKANVLMGQVVLAKVKLIESEDQLHIEKRIISHCIDRLDARYKVPVAVLVFDDVYYSSRYKKKRSVSCG